MSLVLWIHSDLGTWLTGRTSVLIPAQSHARARNLATVVRNSPDILSKSSRAGDPPSISVPQEKLRLTGLSETNPFRSHPWATPGGGWDPLKAPASRVIPKPALDLFSQIPSPCCFRAISISKDLKVPPQQTSNFDPFRV